jgi:hypothetical protein
MKFLHVDLLIDTSIDCVIRRVRTDLGFFFDWSMQCLLTMMRILGL